MIHNRVLTVLVVAAAFIFIASMTSVHAAKPYRPGVIKSPLPQTGQTTSYLPGDDGDLQMGVPWPIPRFIDHGDGTITDRLTGLMWTQNAQQIPGTMTWAKELTHAMTWTSLDTMIGECPILENAEPYGFRKSKC